MSIYCGQSETNNSLSCSEQVVLDLMEPLLNAGRTLYVDNYYTSVNLANLLLERKTHLVGTLRNRRKHNSIEIEKTKIRKGECIARIRDPGIVMLKWKDKRDVLALSTKHLNEMIAMPSRADPERKKPVLIMDYNNSKAYIDLSDQQKAYNTPPRRGIKWYRKLAVELLLGTSLVIAHVVYKKLTLNKIQITEFKKDIVKHIFEKHSSLAEPESQQKAHIDQHDLEQTGKRLRCTVCYENINAEFGRRDAQNKTPRTTWSCSTFPLCGLKKDEREVGDLSQ
ncbi:piggyBac transposable element-derived protein 4 [Leptinotarsa decemlineata]|uniref:piggyBac transposable element-derived protein 4 n=1 Tax=Leptinotarsa decemlineata TaxID=7539 RepID=UPI003D30D3E6